MPTCLACCPPSQPSSAVESRLGTALTGRWSRKHRVPTSLSSHRLSGACVLGPRGTRGTLWTLASTCSQLSLPAPCPQHPLLPGERLPPLGPQPAQWVHPSQLSNLHPQVLPQPLTGGGLLDPCCQPWGARSAFLCKVQMNGWEAQRELKPAQGHTKHQAEKCEQSWPHSHTHPTPQGLRV